MTATESGNATDAIRTSSDRIGPSDSRYADLIRRGINKRFTGAPDYVRLVGSTAQVVDAVQTAVREGLRLAVRSGGHCLEGFVGDPDVRVVLDASLMNALYFDETMGAFAVEPGLLLDETYRRLNLGWGVTLPAGECPSVGIGGHIAGGAFGFLCRQHGLAADHLYAVEVVVVDEDGTARAVVATREQNDPNRELWWAHTGGGGGNFGVVTRYWLRSPNANGGDPSTLLPKAPESVLTCTAEWNWDDIDEAAFTRLVRNYGEWCERNSAPDSPTTALFSILTLPRRQAGKITLRAMVTGGADAQHLLDEHTAAISDGARTPTVCDVSRMSWLKFALDPFPPLFTAGMDDARMKVKDAFLRKRHTDRQIAAAYHHLTRADVDVPGGAFSLATYGGRVNAVAPNETASAQRESILTTAYVVGWGDPRDEARSLDWVRQLYRDVFAETGGVPVPGDVSNGALINHPDADLADPAWNTSGVPWSTLYYKDNYSRLQRIKAKWDPRDVFRHVLSIRPA
ncbi:MAG: FAD-binding protein [bacterium]